MTPQSPQTAWPTQDQVFKCTNEYGTFGFKPPQHSIPKLWLHLPCPALNPQLLRQAAVAYHYFSAHPRILGRKDLLVITLSSQRRRKSQNPVVICPPSWASWRHRVAKYRAWTQDFDPGDWPGASFFSICDLALPFVVKYRMHTRQEKNSRVLDKLYFFLSTHLSPSVYCLFYDITNTVSNYCRFLSSAANTSTLSLW